MNGHKGWTDKKGAFGIYIHNLTDQDGQQTIKGANPFDQLSLAGRRMSQIVQTYNPPFTVSAEVRNYIAANFEAWVEQAILTRSRW